MALGTSGSRRNWRANAILSSLLVLCFVALGLRLARAKLDSVVDLTEEQLSQPSSVGVRMLQELDDVLEVRAYFTGEVELGVAQLAKRRLVDQLEQVKRLAGGHVTLTYRDPNGSSEARAEALALGLAPQTVGAQRGTSAVSQDLYLGLVLRYRGREGVLPFVLPQSFEYAFLSQVRRLERGSEPRLGLLVGRGAGAPEELQDEFGDLRALLAEGRQLVDLVDLDVSGTISSDLGVVFVVAPRELHPRCVFALDQYVQQGGRLAVCLDRTAVDPSAGKVERIDTGLEALLSAWGVPFSERVVWDTEGMNPVKTAERMEIAGRMQTTREATIAYPAWVQILPAGLNADEVVTTRLPGLDLFWAHPLLPLENSPVPEGLQRTVLAESSKASFAVGPTDDLIDLDPSVVQNRSISLLATSEARALPVAAILRGRFPSPFEAGAPAPFDAVQDALYQASLVKASEDGDSVPQEPVLGTTDEPVLSQAADSVVVVFGDADWVRNQPYLTPRNRMALEDLVDWLSLEEDLLALRARQPVSRPLRDFVQEARAARGLPAMVAGQGIPADDVARLHSEEEAAAAAARKRWTWVAASAGGASLLALLLAGLVRLLLFRAPQTKGLVR